MNTQPDRRSVRLAGANPVTVLLLAATLLLLIIILVVLLSAPSGTGGSTTEGRPAKTAAQEAIANPDRIRETLQAGKTYEVVLKGGLDVRVEDKDWGIKQVTNLAFAFEMLATRTIESNDGKRIVEVRHFQKIRAAKLLSEVESVQIDLGTPGTLILGVLEYVSPGSGTAMLAAQPLAEAILEHGVQQHIDSQTAKAFGLVDSLSGKKVRIVYVNGSGMESIEPIDCQLDQSERAFLENLAILSDCYLFPDLTIKTGQTWSVDGRQLAGFLDPSMRGVPSGEVVIRREADHQANGKHFANLRIESGQLEIDSSDATAYRMGTFAPRGNLRYNMRDSFTEAANLHGDIRIEQVSRDHLLFEASFKTRPNLKVDYACRMQ